MAKTLGKETFFLSKIRKKGADSTRLVLLFGRCLKRDQLIMYLKKCKILLQNVSWGLIKS